MRLRILFFSLLLCIPVFAFPGISGRYKMYGTRADSSTYKGIAQFTRVGNGVYTATWTFSDGSVETGTGVLQNGQLSFVFKETDTLYGVITYTVGKHTSKGHYTLYGMHQKGAEKLVKIQ